MSYSHLVFCPRYVVLVADKVLYAPMTDVGALIYDKDATFLEVGGSAKPSSELAKLGLEDKRTPLIEEIKNMPTGPAATEAAEDALQLFAGAAPLRSSDVVQSQLCVNGLDGYFGWRRNPV